MAYAKIIILFLLLGNFPTVAQTPKQYFGSKYQTSVLFLKKHKKLWIEYFGEQNAPKAMAIVFPEVLRYNTLANEAEVKLLQSMYVKFGKRYTDFSVGYFQMKPSFAETIEQKMGITLTHTEQERQKRLERLMSLEGQMQYLKDFWQIMHQLHPLISQKKDIEVVRFLASAYNYGFLASQEKIEYWSTQKAFPSGKNSAVRFSYADISEEFYKNEAPKIFQK
jgi:hypothetical protein